MDDPDFYLPLNEKTRQEKQLNGDVDRLFSGGNNESEDLDEVINQRTNEDVFGIPENEDIVLGADDEMPELEIVDDELLDAEGDEAIELLADEGDPEDESDESSAYPNKDEMTKDMKEKATKENTRQEELKYASQNKKNTEMQGNIEARKHVKKYAEKSVDKDVEKRTEKYVENSTREKSPEKDKAKSKSRGKEEREREKREKRRKEKEKKQKKQKKAKTYRKNEEARITTDDNTKKDNTYQGERRSPSKLISDSAASQSGSGFSSVNKLNPKKPHRSKDHKPKKRKDVKKDTNKSRSKKRRREKEEIDSEKKNNEKRKKKTRKNKHKFGQSSSPSSSLLSSSSQLPSSLALTSSLPPPPPPPPPPPRLRPSLSSKTKSSSSSSSFSSSSRIKKDRRKNSSSSSNNSNRNSSRSSRNNSSTSSSSNSRNERDTHKHKSESMESHRGHFLNNHVAPLATHPSHAYRPVALGYGAASMGLGRIIPSNIGALTLPGGVVPGLGHHLIRPALAHGVDPTALSRISGVNGLQTNHMNNLQPRGPMNIPTPLSQLTTPHTLHQMQQRLRQAKLSKPGSKRRDFDGFIFGCNTSTYNECMQLGIFGGPRKLLPLVQTITPYDTPLFLFHYTNRTLYGVFEATSPGMENLMPQAWCGTRAGERGNVNGSPFPAQVAFRYKYRFLPLPESKFQGIGLTYFYDKPEPKLNKKQIRKLIELFAENDAATVKRAADQLIQFFRLK